MVEITDEIAKAMLMPGARSELVPRQMMWISIKPPAETDEEYRPKVRLADDFAAIAKRQRELNPNGIV